MTVTTVTTVTTIMTKKRTMFTTLACTLLLVSTTGRLDACDVVPAPAPARIEVCFVLDTTGSMSGLIEGAKQKIWSIANELLSAEPTPQVMLALIAYRDRGDQYVTRTFDLTEDIDAIYAHLQSFRAAGGGDGPESVNQALHEAVTRISWSESRDVLKIIFLVGDAPPHMDYADEVLQRYPDVCRAAVKKDLIINSVQCGTLGTTTAIWREIARLSEGAYVAIAQSGDMVVTTTPMDQELSRLNVELGTTLIPFGDSDARRKVEAKQAAAEEAPAPVAADRLAYNAKSGRVVQGGGDLIDALERDLVELATLDDDELPAQMRTLDEMERQAYVQKVKGRRAQIQAAISKLLKKREAFIRAERKRLGADGDGFDQQVSRIVREQASRKGIAY